MKAYYIKFVFDKTKYHDKTELYVKTMVFDKDGFGFIDAQNKDDAGIFEIEKCEAFKQAMLEKAMTLKIEFEEFVKEDNSNDRL